MCRCRFEAGMINELLEFTFDTLEWAQLWIPVLYIRHDWNRDIE